MNSSKPSSSLRDTLSRLVGHAVVIGFVILAGTLARVLPLMPRTRIVSARAQPVAVTWARQEKESRLARAAFPLTVAATGPRQYNNAVRLAVAMTLTVSESEDLVNFELASDALAAGTRPMLPLAETWGDNRAPMMQTAAGMTATLAAGGGYGGAGWVNVRRCTDAAVPTEAMGTGQFRWPTDSHFVSGYDYGPTHLGVDLAGYFGNPVYAAEGGMVVWAGSNADAPGYGLMVVLDHGNGWQTLYGHLNSVSVRCEQSVLKGTVLGGIGTTGHSTGTHLHFEVWHNGRLVNPLPLLR
jgi:murein DD-endopeptidase MepM/ murein hydrolase activator NlpD